MIAGSEGEHFAQFCADHLVQSIEGWDGEPLTLEPFQRSFMDDALAFDADGWPVWRSVVLVVGRKNGKTTLLAGYALYRLLTSSGLPEVLLAASSDRQAGRLFDATALFIRRSPTLSSLCRVRDHAGEIVREDGGGRILRMSSDPGRLHGYNPSLVICDELAQWTTPSLRRAWAALTTGGGARRSAQVFTITTAGEAHHRESGILGQLIDGNEAAGEVSRPHGGLTVSRNHASQTLVYNYSAPTADRLDVEAIKQANPASWITSDYLTRQAANPELSDAEFLQLHGCVWAAGQETFISLDDWRRLGDGDPLEVSEPVAVMIDGSYRYDTTAVAWARVADDGRVDVACHVFSARVDAPHHTLCPGGRISLADVEGFVLGVNCREVAFDPRFMARSAEIISDAMPSVPVVELEPQSGAMYDALAFFHRGVAEGTIRHAGDPVVAAHVAACQGEQVERGWRVTKRNHTRPIDAVIAMAGAVWRASEAVPSVEPMVVFA